MNERRAPGEEHGVARRNFVLGVLLVPTLGRFLVACGSSVELPGARPDTNGSFDEGSDVGATDADETDATVDGGDASSDVVFTSTIYVTHVHTFAIARALLDGPPAPSSELDGETSVFEGHAHTIKVTVAQLTSVQMGGSVTVTTGRTNAHTHDFTFTRVA